jgi:hypothetical protein
MKEKTGIQKFIGKEVYLFPGDTYWKTAILVSWHKDSGYEFEITGADPRAKQKCGDTWFYNNSNKVVMTLV